MTLDDGTRLPVDRHLDSTPSAIFDAIAIVLAEDAVTDLAHHDLARAFARDAFVHLKGATVAVTRHLEREAAVRHVP